MYSYNMTQWLSFLIIYSFLGWVWECCYVSVRQKKWVNRGFMHGPLLPIYGSGAVIVLFAALPFKGNVVEVYIAGMVAATILEYCTGAAMEAIFKVRYWDYSNNKFNLHGHICLFCSLGWGFFSIAMVYVLHQPFEKVVLSIPENILSPMVHVIMMIASADYGISFKTAIELRDVLVKLEQAKKEAQLLQKRIEVYEAFFADDLMQKKEKLEAERKEFSDRIHEKKHDFAEKGEAELLELKDSLKAKKDGLIGLGEEARDHMLAQIEGEKEEIQKKLASMKERMDERRYMKQDFARLLRRNPGAVSVKYKNAFAEIKNKIEHAKEYIVK